MRVARAGARDRVSHDRPTLTPTSPPSRSSFSKLRDVEVMLQSYNGPDPATVAEVMKILYATDEDFVAVDEAAGPPPS